MGKLNRCGRCRERNGRVDAAADQPAARVRILKHGISDSCKQPCEVSVEKHVIQQVAETGGCDRESMPVVVEMELSTSVLPIQSQGAVSSAGSHLDWIGLIRALPGSGALLQRPGNLMQPDSWRDTHTPPGPPAG